MIKCHSLTLFPLPGLWVRQRRCIRTPRAAFRWIVQESPKSSLGDVFAPTTVAVIQRMNRSFQTWVCWRNLPPCSKPAHFPRAWLSRAAITNLPDCCRLFLRNDKGCRNSPPQLHPRCGLCNTNGHMFFPVIFKILPN